MSAAAHNDDHVTVTSDSDAVGRLRTTFASLARHADPAASSAALINELRKRYDL